MAKNLNTYANVTEILLKFGNPNSQFQSKYMARFTFPKEITDAIPCLEGRAIFCFVGLYKTLLNTLRELIAKGLHKEIKTYDGCFIQRQMRTGSQPSKHSWGMAIDLNQATNMLGGKVTFTTAFLEVWMRHGWYLGAYFKNKPDGMHFELSKEQLGLQ